MSMRQKGKTGHSQLLSLAIMCLIAFGPSAGSLLGQPIKLHPGNSNYFSYKNKPILLITSAEHYGALINLDFDYVKYFDAISKYRMNYTRLFTGSFVEREEDIGWMKYNNTLAPRPDRVIVPWARSNVPGYRNGGNKFDLESWDEHYFERLKDLLTEAKAKDIIVELTLFGNQYGDGLWCNNPLHPDNNIQRIGPSGEGSWSKFQTKNDHQLLAYQEAMVRKIVTELNDFDNLFYEISNEPYNGITDTTAVDEWHNHMVKLIKDTEAGLPKKHLIATCFSVFDNPDVSVLNFHYVRVKEMKPLETLLTLKKVVNMDETMGSVIHSNPTDTRIEAWDHILRGGGAYNNLSWEYTPHNAEGTEDAVKINKYLQNLQRFMSGFDYARMAPDYEMVLAKPDSSFVRVLGEKGKQYAIYLHRSKIKGDGKPEVWGYEAFGGIRQDELTIDLPAGKYEIRWMNPSTGLFYDNSPKIKHPGGKLLLLTPQYTTDIGLQIKRRKR